MIIKTTKSKPSSTNKIIITSLLLAIGVILHQITPPIFLGMRPDLLLVFMILSIILNKDLKISFITGIVAGVLGALVTAFPGGQLPNIIDKIITSIVVFGLYKSFSKCKNNNVNVNVKNIINSPLKLASIYFIGTLISGSIFLVSALILFGLPASFLVLFSTIVIPTAVINCVIGFFIHKMIIGNKVLRDKFNG